MPTNKTRFIARAAIIAAAYAILTLSLAPIAYGSLQLRLAEALTVLAYFSPAAVCGLTVGCEVANFWSPFGITDVVFGALATGIAAVLTYFMPKKGLWKFLAPLPSVLVNAAVIGAVIAASGSGGASFWPAYGANALAVALPQFLVCYVAGLPLLLYLDSSGLGRRLL